MTEAPIDNHTDFMQHVWDLEKQNAAQLKLLKKVDSWFKANYSYIQ